MALLPTGEVLMTRDASSFFFTPEGGRRGGSCRPAAPLAGRCGCGSCARRRGRAAAGPGGAPCPPPPALPNPS
jgi:hypothetical protein